MTPRRIAPVLALALLSACASAPAYRPADGRGAGFSDAPLSEERHRIRFQGPFGMGRKTVERLALRRAAEVTLAAGGGHFRILSTAVETETEREIWDNRPWLGGGWGSRRGFGLGVGLGVGYGYGPVRRRTAVDLEIVALPGPRPAGDAVSYDAAAVLAETAALAAAR